jgi:hypothetical protein
MSYSCDISNSTRVETHIDNLSFHRWYTSMIHILTSKCHTRPRLILTAKVLRTIRCFSMFHDIRSLTGGTVNWFYHHHRHSFPRLDVYGTTAPPVCRYQGGSKKSTNLGHYHTFYTNHSWAVRL